MADTLVLRGATLVDGTGGPPVADAVVVIEDDRIVQVGGAAPGGAREIDLTGTTLTPGLIDAHGHLTIVDMADSDGSRSPLAVTAARIFRVCELALQAGFTTVRDAAGADGGLASAIRLGLVPGPRILPSGPIISQVGGHGDHRLPWDHHHHGHTRGYPGLAMMSATVNGPDEVRLAAREAFRHGATQLKVCLSGGVVSFTDRLEDAQLTVEELRAAVEEAEARDTYVLAHSHNSRGIQNGLEAGVRCFEHATMLDHATAHAIAAAGAYVVPTFAVIRLMRDEWQEWGIPEEVLPKVNDVESMMAKSMKLAIDAGVKIGSGSDLLGPTQNRRGLELLIKAQLIGPMAALVSATRTNAEILRLDHEIGTVAEGKLADLVAFAGNPLDDPELFDVPDAAAVVIQRGRVVKDLR